MREYFTRLLGNRETAQRLGRAVESGRTAHAFLIGGPAGSGKSVLALELARALNCECRDGNSPLPCGKCSACVRIADGSFPDVKQLSKPQDRATLGVEPVKALREDMFLSSSEAKYKIYIINDAECMTPEAQNALLKVLEEPPADVVIMLLARECDKILTTIKSRTQYIAMSKFTDEKMASILPNISPDAEALMKSDKTAFDAIVMSADGRLGEAMRLSDRRCAEECRAKRTEITRILRAMRTGAPRAELYSAIMEMQSSKRTELITSIESVTCAIRDLTALQMHLDAKLVFFTERGEAAALAHEIGTARLMQGYDAFSEARSLCSRNANTQNLLTNLLARLCRNY